MIKKGSITIYFAGIFLVIISLIFMLIESARLTYIRARVNNVSSISIESAFAGFTKELFDDYGVFGLYSDEEELKKSINKWQESNIELSNVIFKDTLDLYQIKANEIETSKIGYITDEDGAVFAKQVSKYMKYRMISMGADKLIDNYNEFDSGLEVLDVRNLEDIDKIDKEKIKKVSDNIEEKIDSLKVDLEEAEDEYKEAEEVDLSIEKLEQDLLEKIGSILKEGLFEVVLEDPTAISKAFINHTYLPSIMTAISKDAAVAIEIGKNNEDDYFTNKDFSNDSSSSKGVKDNTAIDKVLGGVDKAIFLGYLKDKFSCYTKSLEDTSLAYELEYILMGDSKDENNLYSTIVSLIFQRASFNVIHILMDPKKSELVDKIAMGITAATPVPGLKEVVKFTLISLWATAEGIIDAKDLLAGKKVQLIKDSKNWTLSLANASKINKDTLSVNDGKSGKTYEEYVLGMIFLKNRISCYFRTMDIIQENISLRNDVNFRMNRCLTKALIKAEYSAPAIFSKISIKYINNYKVNNEAYFSY